ncbi:MAG: hypothetical protein R3B13_08110 [Polyangiaceae bacterium]
MALKYASVSALLCTLTFTSAGWAQGAEPSGEEGESGAAPAEEKAAETGASAEEGADTKSAEAKEGEAAARAEAMANDENDGSPIEEPGKTYRFLGLRYRGIIIPKFMMNLFGDGGATVYNHAFGPEFTVRKDGFEYVFSLWYASYSMSPTPFKASGDPEVAWEIVESKLKAVFLTSDFLWSSEMSPEFSINYGMGAGFGIVFGDLIREQSTPANGVAGDPYDYIRCTSPGVPNTTYCGTDNDHYNGYTEPSWANGGSKPIIFPWLVAQTGFRYKPHRNFAARLDAGFGTSGFFVGLAGNYGL